MRHTTCVVLQGLLALWLLAGCASSPPRVLSAMAPSYATLPNGSEPLNPTQISPMYAALTTIPGDNLVRHLERQRPGIRDRLIERMRKHHPDQRDRWHDADLFRH